VCVQLSFLSGSRCRLDVRRQIEDGLFYIANWSLLFAVPWQSHLEVSWRSLGVQQHGSNPDHRRRSHRCCAKLNRIQNGRIEDPDFPSHASTAPPTRILALTLLKCRAMVFKAHLRPPVGGKKGRNKHPMVIQSQEQQIGGTGPGSGGRPHLVVSTLQGAKNGEYSLQKAPRRKYQGWFGIHLGESRLKRWAQFWTLASGAEPDDGCRQELARTSRAPTHSIEPRSLAPAEEVSAPLDVR
jgi:hypothetical protein